MISHSHMNFKCEKKEKKTENAPEVDRKGKISFRLFFSPCFVNFRDMLRKALL